MINKYRDSEIILEEVGSTIYRVRYTIGALMEIRVGGSFSFVNFRGGPYIAEGMNLKDIDSSFPNRKVVAIGVLKNIYIVTE